MASKLADRMIGIKAEPPGLVKGTAYDSLLT
jgi:hypothetical protein